MVSSSHGITTWLQKPVVASSPLLSFAFHNFERFMPGISHPAHVSCKEKTLKEWTRGNNCSWLVSIGNLVWRVRHYDIAKSRLLLHDLSWIPPLSHTVHVVWHWLWLSSKLSPCWASPPSPKMVSILSFMSYKHWKLVLFSLFTLSSFSVLIFCHSVTDS